MPAGRKPGFGETCGSCGRDLHSCFNCRFFRKGAHWDCDETIQDAVSDKERRNFCDWFETSPALLVSGEGKKAERAAADKARKDLDALFGG
jgi:hypothetical protein